MRSRILQHEPDPPQPPAGPPGEDGRASFRSNNLAARMGRWSASHWKTAVLGWILLMLLFRGFGGLSVAVFKPAVSGLDDRGIEALLKRLEPLADRDEWERVERRFRAQ